MISSVSVTTRLFSALCCILFSTPVLGGRTYFIEEYSGFDSGWSMDGGTLTTTEFVGTVNDANINSVFTDWSIGMTSPNGSHLFTPANSTFALDRNVHGESGILEVAQQHVFLPFDGFGYNLSLTTSLGQEILWNGPDYDDNISGLMVDYESVTLSDGGMSSLVHFGRCEVLDDDCPLEGRLVAAVTEPTALMLLSVGMAGLGRSRGPRRPSDRSRLS